MFANSIQGLILQFLERLDRAFQANPSKGWLFAVDRLAFFNEAQGREHVRNIVKPSDFGLELLLLFVGVHVLLPLVDALGCLF